jgi:hypothetical protein
VRNVWLRENVYQCAESSEVQIIAKDSVAMIDSLPVKSYTDMVLRQSPLVISPPVSLGNDTNTVKCLHIFDVIQQHPNW